MILNFILFTVKIERNHRSIESKIAQYELEQHLKARQEAQYIQAASMPAYVSRV